MPINVSLLRRLADGLAGSERLGVRFYFGTGVGLLLTVGGVAAYLVGVAAPFPGRAFSVTAVMVGVTLLAVGRSDAAEATA